ncbi:MAG: hypothetical protein DA408_16055 [Bacteroidetes bacterium]|nr:MAG: hypothetical protein C7N36_06595 [Bacteroidota bacterium]PTM10431.1 MAG: hypothetical protein DA408_16055 [Bacteroidota bacterium]
MEADDNQGHWVSASSELVEGLDFNIDTLSRNELETLSSLQTWINIWKFALALVAIRRLKFELPESLAHLNQRFPANFRLSNMVTELITNQKEFITSSFLRDNLNHLLAQLNDIRSPFILFIDRLDQALDTLLSNEEYKYFDSEEDENIPFKVWKHAQCGLLLTSYNFTTAVNRHIKIFATARHEALNVETQLIANLKNYCTDLKYTKSEIKEIFETNIANTPESHLHPNPETQQLNPYLSFVGFTDMAHVQARDEHQVLREEHVFDFILRHTFERPREVVRMGKLIFENLLAKKDYHTLSVEEKITKVRRVVNQDSHETILSNYLKEIVPKFREEYIDECANKFQQNLIYKNELKKVDPSIVNYLYRMGLIGYVVSNKQFFLPASQYIHSTESIQQSDYYMLHPSLDHKLQQVRDFNDFYNEYCIIGNRYPFYAPPLYLNARKMDNPVSYYLPKALPGRGTEEEAWKTANIFASPEALFRRYFIDEQDSQFLQRSQRMINNALKVLNTLANSIALQKVRQQFALPDTEWQDWELELEMRLHDFHCPYAYTQRIESTDQPSLALLEARIFGRLITAGALIYLDVDYFGVKQVVQQFSLQRPKDVDGEETAVRFLRQAFYLANLPNMVPDNTTERLRLLFSLADFEQELLRRWWWNYKNHIIFEKEYFKENHHTYLRQLMGVDQG